MDLLSHLTTNNNSPSSSTSSGTGDKLKKLQISSTSSSTTTNKKENNTNTNLSYRSASSLFNTNKSQIIPDQSTATTQATKQDYEEILITIRKSEKGFGFELKNGILIVRVIPNSPAFNSGIKVGDLILKVNGTCVRSKDANEITSMIHESSSFVSLALQRKLAPVEQVEVLVENNDKLKNVTNQLINNSNSDIDNLNDYENKILNELSESCREDTNTTNNNNENNQFISDDINLNESISSKTHRKQFSIPDDWIQPVSENNQVQKRDIKKSLSTINHSTNSKSYQTKSLSNIIMSKSTSDNELDQNVSSSKQRMNNSNEADLFTIPYKDDLALLNDSNLEDSFTTNDKPPAWDLSLFTNYLQLVEKPVNMALFLNYLLSSSDSPKNLYFCLFVDEMLNSTEKKETIHRWSYELYSTFLMPNAPLKLKISENLILKLDDYFDKNTTANDNLKKIYDDIRQEAVEIVNLQLSKFREVNQMGLANLFQGGELAKACYLYKNDSDQVRQALANLFINYLQELVRLNDLNRISTDWNDSRLQEAQCSALLSSFATYIKRFNIPIKYLARYELEKIPSFVNRKFKPKKQSATSLRGHSFIEFSSACTRILCSKCKQAFWGIGNQGLICQKSKCEIKFHRSCLQTGVSFECQSKEKTIRTDYKEKLDSFQKILFGSKTKTKDDAVNDSSSSSQSSFFLQGFTGSTDSHLNHKKDYERQASIISSNFSISSSSGGSFTPDTNNLDNNHNLPVELAIKKFESMLNGKMTTTSSSNSVGTRSKLINDTLLQQTDEPISSTTTATSDNLNFFSPNNPKSLYPAFNSMSNSKNIKIKRNSNLKGKEQACKRVGSLKSNDTNKKIKTHVHRSKSDPHPDEIKHAFTSDLNQHQLTPPPPPPAPQTSKRYSIDFSSIPEPISPKSNNLNSKSTLPKPVVNQSRNSWMNDSDMEVDEELPNLSVNIEREKFEKLTKKEVKLQEVINELIHTEQKHVRNLKIMKHHFYIPIKVEYLLSEDERNLLFPNLDEILDLHSLFNNRLKKLRRENPIVSIEQLITILQDQFQNENGTRFQSACAAFCQNQSEAMKFLQTKSKLLADKFTLFLAKSENDSICRKLHLKDFLPTEVQRLVKYRLLFQEMSKNTRDDDQETKKRLSDCIEASTKISLYVNKAVTECENKKRVIEIQNKLDTKEFDQYCNKSHVLMPYRNLQLINRRLVYEGELEWKLSNIKLMALLFEDILVFLETVRHESSNDEKRRYVLRPLIYIIGKTKQMFTPVIPLSCINSFRSMHDKRSFHLVAIIEDSIKLSSNSNAYSSSLITTKQTFQSTKPIQAQMLFILIAKSGDERNKWTSHLQDLTGKMMQSVGNDVPNTNVQDLTTTNNTTKTSTISASNLLNSSNSIISSKNNANSISSSALISSSTKNKEFLSLDSEKNRTNTMSPTKEEDLNSQLETNTNEILNLLKLRHDLLSKILKLNPSPDSLNIVETNNKVLINNSIGLVGSMTTNLLTESNMNQQAKSIQILIKLEENLKNLNQNMNETPATTPATTTTTSVKLPDLSSTMTNISNKKPSIIISSNVNSRAAAIMNNNDLNDCIAADAVSTTTTTSELTADLSEDEQINYYDEYDYNSSNDNINDDENDDEDDDNNSNNEKINNETKNNQSNDMMRRFSDSSNKTLCILAGKSSNKKKSNISEDADDEEDDTAYNSGSIKTTTTSTTGKNINSEIINNDLQQLNDSQNSNITTDIDVVVETEIKKCFRSSNEILKSLAPLEINSLSSSSSSQTKKHSLNDDANDLSDDEVKDYLTLKDNFDEISHV